MSGIRLSKSMVGHREKEALARVIDESYLGMGRFVQEFEERLADYLGAQQVICVSSGTAALHLAVMGCGLEPGDEVLVQSLTFLATFQAISGAQAVPVACEVVPETCAINLEDAQRKLTGRTRAIMPVHYAGRPGNLDGVYEFAERYGLHVIEDAAHAFGSLYRGRKIGSFGDVVCFSFDGIKNITSGEGGAVVTANDAVAQFVRDGRLLGIHRDTEKRYRGERSWEFDVMHQGYRYHMSNLFAAVGLAQLDRFEKLFKPRRQLLARRYHAALKNVTGLILFPDDYDEIVPHIFPVRVLQGKRDALRKHLLDNAIECGVHYYPNHLLTYYGARWGELPITEALHEELLSLPLHPELSEDQQDLVIQKLLEVFQR